MGVLHVSEPGARLSQQRPRAKDRLLSFDAAAVGREVERLAREPVAGCAMRGVGALSKLDRRGLALQIEVEPGVFLRVEPRLGGRQHQWRVRRHDELDTRVVMQDAEEFAQRLENHSLPAWMKMALHLVEEHRDLSGRFLSKLLRGQAMLAPGPGQHVGKSGHPTNARRRMKNGHGPRVLCFQRGDVARVVHGQPQRWPWLEHPLGILRR